MSAIEKIKQQVSENPVMLYMKGTPDMPMCGFHQGLSMRSNSAEKNSRTVMLFLIKKLCAIYLVLRIGQLFLNYTSKVN